MAGGVQVPSEKPDDRERIDRTKDRLIKAGYPKDWVDKKAREARERGYYRENGGR